MAKTQSLHEVKQGKPTSKKNSNIITDSDYFLRDREEEAKRGYPNTIDLTPKAVETKKAVETEVKPATPETKKAVETEVKPATPETKVKPATPGK